MPTIVPGVTFDTVAREWRAKWSVENDKAALGKAQAVLDKVPPPARAPSRHTSVRARCRDSRSVSHQHLPALKALDGVKEVKDTLQKVVTLLQQCVKAL